MPYDPTIPFLYVILVAHHTISRAVGRLLLPQELAGTTVHCQKPHGFHRSRGPAVGLPWAFRGRWKRAAGAYGSWEGAALLPWEAGPPSPLRVCAQPQRLQAGSPLPVRVRSSSGGPAWAGLWWLADPCLRLCLCSGPHLQAISSCVVLAP